MNLMIKLSINALIIEIRKYDWEEAKKNPSPSQSLKIGFTTFHFLTSIMRQLSN